MSDWLSPQEREEFRAYNEKRYKEQHGACLERINQLRQELSLAEEGLANYQQDLDRVTQSNLKFIEANKSLADNNLALRETLYQIQQWRLTWAIACPDDECKVCQQFDKELRSVLPQEKP